MQTFLPVADFAERFEQCIGIVYNATVWRSVGNYGSTVYDLPVENSDFIEWYICDECLRKGRIVYAVYCETKTGKPFQRKIENGLLEEY